MELTLRNIGKIDEASITINGITIIAGENNTGKSTVGRALYCIFNAFHNIDDKINELFYNYWTVAAALIIFGILFIVIENRNKTLRPKINSIAEITWKAAFLVGIFQLIAAVFPGTSRSGATILGGILIGMSRVTAAEFTFFLAVPVMLGASLLKLVKFGFVFTSSELVILLTGMIVAFVVSILVIKFLLSYIRRHDFKIFGWYRILLGAVDLGYFLVVQ